MTTYRTNDGGIFTRQTIESALNSHKAAGLFRDWRRDERTHGERGTRKIPLYTVTLHGGHKVELADLWEARAFVGGLASAREAYSAAGLAIPAEMPRPVPAEVARNAADVPALGVYRSLAFTALLELTDWFGPLESRQGEQEVSDLLNDWAVYCRTYPNTSIWEFAKGRKPREARK